MAPRGLIGHSSVILSGVSMITYLTDSIFNSPAKVLTNPVNTVGVMGKGLALEFKTRYPDMFKKYKRLCDTRQLTIGRLYYYESANTLPDVINFPTKQDWRRPSKLEYIEKGLYAFVERYDCDWDITSIAFPKLGCGYGNLEWSDVKPVMEHYLAELPIEVYIHV